MEQYAAERQRLFTAQLEPIARSLSLEQWAALPELPADLCEDLDGVLHIKEIRCAEDGCFCKEMIPERRFEPIRQERRAELEAAAQQLSGGADDAKKFFNQLSDGRTILENPEIPFFLKHEVPPEVTTNLAILKPLREAALERLYTDKVMETAKSLIALHMPEALPRGPAVTVINRGDHRTSRYHGRFGNTEVISLCHPAGSISENLRSFHESDDAVIGGVHELAHQLHSEHEGRGTLAIAGPDTASYNQVTVTDPWAAFYLAQAYEAHFRATAPEYYPDDNIKLAYDVGRVVCEMLAFVVEAEVRDKAGLRPLIRKDGRLSVTLEADSEVHQKAVESLLAGADSPRRRELFRQLLRIDLVALPDLSLPALQEVMNRRMKF